MFLAEGELLEGCVFLCGLEGCYFGLEVEGGLFFFGFSDF